MDCGHLTRTCLLATGKAGKLIRSVKNEENLQTYARFFRQHVSLKALQTGRANFISQLSLLQVTTTCCILTLKSEPEKLACWRERGRERERAIFSEKKKKFRSI